MDDEEEIVARVDLDYRELSTILAALRYWTREGLRAGDCAEADIADDGGNITPLDAPEIDDLCERINTTGL